MWFLKAGRKIVACDDSGMGRDTKIKMYFKYIAFHFPAVFAKNFHVKAVMKTSVLLSWEIPENYNSAMPFKVSCFVIHETYK